MGFGKEDGTVGLAEGGNGSYGLVFERFEKVEPRSFYFGELGHGGDRLGEDQLGWLMVMIGGEGGRMTSLPSATEGLHKLATRKMLLFGRFIEGRRIIL